MSKIQAVKVVSLAMNHPVVTAQAGQGNSQNKTCRNLTNNGMGNSEILLLVIHRKDLRSEYWAKSLLSIISEEYVFVSLFFTES